MTNKDVRTWVPMQYDAEADRRFKYYVETGIPPAGYVVGTNYMMEKARAEYLERIVAREGRFV